MKGIQFLNRFMTKNWIRFMGIFATVACYAFLNLCGPLIFRFFIDHVIDEKPINNGFIQEVIVYFGGLDFIHNNLWIGGIVVVMIAILTSICVFLRGYWNGIVSESVSCNLRNALYDHIQFSPYSYHVSIKTGDLIQRCTSDVDQIRRFLSSHFSEIVYSLFTAFFAATVLFTVDHAMAIVAMISMPFLIGYAYYFFTRVQKIFLESDELEGEMTATIQESLSGIRVIKAFNSEQAELAKFEKKSSEYTEKTFKLLKQLGLYWSTSDLICLSQILVVVLVGIFRVRQGDFTIGNLFVFIAYEAMILWPIRNLGRLLAEMGKMTVSIGRLQEIFDVALEDVTCGSTDLICGEIEFKHVDFHYSDNSLEILHDVSFKIKKGQTVALMGPTGSGKSSLVHLLTRLYDPIAGEIYIDGKEIREYQKKHLRFNIGLILQEPFLFSKTIYDNIRISKVDAHQEDVQRVAKIASIHDVIEEFDRGYHTLVGEKGVTLSGGQKQRVAIARTILNQTPILIFDDSLSAVDSETDATIRHGLKALQKETTTIIITQRIASAQEADLILVLENGMITQQGTHEKLLQEEGLYQRIAKIQSGRVMEGCDFV